MKPISERIILAIIAQLGTILKSNNYETDAGLNILRSVKTIDSTPAIIVWDLGEKTSEGAGNHRSMTMELSVAIDCHVAADLDETGVNLELVKADVKKSLMSWAFSGGIRDNDGRIGPLIYQSAQTSAREDGSSTESVALQFSVVFKEAYGNPYSTN